MASTNHNKEGMNSNDNDNDQSRPLSPLSIIQEKLRSPRSKDGDDNQNDDGNDQDKRGGKGGGAQWKNLMKKLDMESRGLKQKLKRLKKGKKGISDSNASQRSTLQQILSELPVEAEKKHDALEIQLKTFATRHQSHHRPIALVTSGGTATDLEVRTVRYLDNFSTGQRGAVSVEEFLKRGYAVIHLWREGSAAPYSRVMNRMLGVRQANHAMGFDALGKMFEGQMMTLPEDESDMDEGLDDNDLAAAANNDPWLTSTRKKDHTSNTSNNTGGGSGGRTSESNDSNGDPTSNTGASGASSMNRMNLTKRILNSTKLQIKLRERANVIKDGLLLTVPFRTVEEYLIRLKLCTEAIHDCQSLGLIYLAAAVSDFYIPRAEKEEHKIQSRDYDIEKIGIKSAEKSSHESAIYIDKETNCLHLKLTPVPKVIPLIREDFAPSAFCVSFKLETEKKILVEKAKIAIQKYDMHMVIGNVLETRYDKVWILRNREIFVWDDCGDQVSQDEDQDGKATKSSTAMNIAVEEVSRTDSSFSSTDELEATMVSHVVEKHFEYIANHFLVNDDSDDYRSKDVMPRTALMAGAEAAARHNAYLKEKKRLLQNELYWKRARDVTLNIAGHALGMYITYVASNALQRRMR